MTQGYIYESFEKGLYTVGYYRPDGKFNPVEDHDDEKAAQRQVSELNGGTGAVGGTETTVTLRDRLAMAALSGIFAGGSVRLPFAEGWKKEPERVATLAYEYADAMVLARKAVNSDEK